MSHCLTLACSNERGQCFCMCDACMRANYPTKEVCRRCDATFRIRDSSSTPKCKCPGGGCP